MARNGRFWIETFGCQMNVNDSEKVEGLLRSEGYERAASVGGADVVFLNTCAVRERAEQKLYSSLGRLRGLKSKNPRALVAVGGCVAQLKGTAILEKRPFVDVVVGTHNIDRVPDLLRRARSGHSPAVDLDRRADPFAVPASAVAHGSGVRAYVTVMEGCNHVCSFCVVPRTRGPELNRPPEDVVAEVRSLVARGYPEVMLLGQTVNAYRCGAVDFASLLEQVSAVEGLRRLRFTTSHPSHVSARLADAMARLDPVCPYLHLPVQSGSDRILAAMRRGYDRQGYLDTVRMLRERIPSLALSSDVIVGYPGESELDFQATVDLVDEVGFDGLFAFMYSPRPGTTAFRLADDVSEAEKLRRLRALNERQQRTQAERNRRRIGGREQVLVEIAEGASRLAGRTPDFKIVHLEGPPALVGRFVDVTVTGAGANSLTARLAQQPIH
jgi:tRNA-2-methylthio-N6-dimethylallyladenosine synthase